MLPIRYRGQTLDLRLAHGTLTVRSRTTTAAPIRLAFGDRTVELEAGGTLEFDLAVA